jgi:hypothetical protein
MYRTASSDAAISSNRRHFQAVHRARPSSTAAMHTPFPRWVNGTHYRAAALLSASPQLAEAVRAAKRFRVVPILLQKSFSTADQNFSRLLVRFSDKYVRDLVSQ